MMTKVILGILAIANLFIAFTYVIDNDIAHVIFHCAIFVCLILSLAIH